MRARTDRAPAARPGLEALEDRTVLSASLPDIYVAFATTKDSHSVTLFYTLNRSVSEFDVRVYRSSDRALDDGDLPVGTVPLNAQVKDDGGRSATRAGLHLLTARGLDLPQAPDRPYVLVVADPDGELAEARESNNAASFRKHLIGAVTHGFSLEPGVPAWATAIAGALENEHGYDEAFAFDWSLQSKVLAPGLSTLAAARLALQINATALTLDRGPGDVVDVHVVGHSRGAVVNALAVDFLPAFPLLSGGWTRETMLDPHPARNLLPFGVAAADLVFGGNNISEGAFFAYRPGAVGVVAMLAVLAGQEAIHDPVPFFAGNVDQAEVFFQNTPGVQEPLDLLNMDSYANSWGYRPEMIPNFSGASVTSQELTGLFFHFQVPLWYLANLGTLLP